MEGCVICNIIIGIGIDNSGHFNLRGKTPLLGSKNSTLGMSQDWANVEFGQYNGQENIFQNNLCCLNFHFATPFD
jgi:hypothetical protein